MPFCPAAPRPWSPTLHEIANVLGTDGIRYMLSTSAELSVNVYFMLSSCVPATDMETAGARLTVEDLRPFIREASHSRPG